MTCSKPIYGKPYITTIHMKECGTVARVWVMKSACEKASIRVEERGF
jgi:hypothetical protein